MTPPLSILFEDHHLIAVNKPAPLLTQAPPGILSLEAMVKAYIKEKYAKPAGVYLGVPHRLDRPVSGAIVFARNTKAARRLAEQFQKREVEKTYWALVAGDVQPESGKWEDWLLKHPEASRTECVDANAPGAKQAALEYCRIANVPGGALLELRPLTGRSHQIRVQAASRGHPVFGDQLYGSIIPFGPAHEHSRDAVIALHARSLTVRHPFRQETVAIIAPLPASWDDRSCALPFGSV
jgi:23S rRNA pseudouridine1911/1915/1917 synthase